MVVVFDPKSEASLPNQLLITHCSRMLGTADLVNGTSASPPRAPLRACGKLAVGGKPAATMGVRLRYLSSSVSIDSLRPHVRNFVEENAKIMQPEDIHVCDGSEEENAQLVQKLQKDGRLIKLQKYENW